MPPPCAVQMLLEAGADVNCTSTGLHSDTPLHRAIESGDVDVVELLMEQ